MNRIATTMAIGSCAMLLASSAWATGEFTRSCRHIDLQGSALDAECKDIHGHHALTGIQLNNYIANIDGRLIWRRRGNFIASSQSCELDFAGPATFLHCDTQRADGSWTSSSINLDEHIANINGGLRFER